MAITVAHLYDQASRRKLTSCSRRNSCTPVPQQGLQLVNQHQSHYQHYLKNACLIGSRQGTGSEEDHQENLADPIKMRRRISLQNNHSTLPHKQDIYLNTLEILPTDTSHVDNTSTIEKRSLQEHLSKSDLSHQIDMKLRRFSNAKHEANVPYLTGNNFWSITHGSKKSDRENFQTRYYEKSVPMNKQTISTPDPALPLQGKDVRTVLAQNGNVTRNKNESMLIVWDKKSHNKLARERLAAIPFYNYNSGVHDESIMTLEERFRFLVNGGKLNQGCIRSKTPLLRNESFENQDSSSKGTKVPRELQKLPIASKLSNQTNTAENERRESKSKTRDRTPQVSEATQASEGDIMNAMVLNEGATRTLKTQPREPTPPNTNLKDKKNENTLKELVLNKVEARYHIKFQRYLKETTKQQEELKQGEKFENRRYSLSHTINAITDKENQPGPKTVMPVLVKLNNRRRSELVGHYHQNLISRESPQPLCELEKNRDLASEIFMKNVHTSGLNGWESDSPQKMRVK